MIPKFRAWDKIDKELYLVDEIHWDEDQLDFIGDGITFMREADEIELMQSTGLFDKNGQEIFEGDITASGNHPIKGVVEFRTDLGMWVNCLKGYDYYEYLGNVASGIEIISNIHENPELLEVIK